MHSEHGKVFNMPSQLSPHARLIVVDLKEIEDNASIRAPVLLSVISLMWSNIHGHFYRLKYEPIGVFKNEANEPNEKSRFHIRI